jgi:hypothetical protein
MRRPFGTISARIALVNAFWDLLSFFETHVLAIERQWALRAQHTSFKSGSGEVVKHALHVLVLFQGVDQLQDLGGLVLGERHRGLRDVLRLR